MIRIDTRPLVASVQNVRPLRDVTISKEPGKPMGSPDAAFVTHSAVAEFVFGSGEYPAPVVITNDALEQRQGESLVQPLMSGQEAIGLTGDASGRFVGPGCNVGQMAAAALAKSVSHVGYDTIKAKDKWLRSKPRDETDLIAFGDGQ